MLKRILKMLGAFTFSAGISLVGQFLLPPFFLRSYGIAKYGEWLVLSATLSYLSSLNFGVTTYASNQLTMLCQRGELEEYRRLQASTLTLLLLLVALGTLISASIGLLPLPTLLHLKTISRSSAGWIAFFLGLQAMCYVLGGYFCSLYMAIRETHRGTMWANCHFLAPILIAAPLAFYRAPFPVIAVSQFAVVATICASTVFDLRRRMGTLPLGLRGANRATARAVLRPSGLFAMVLTQQFLLFQVPVILLQRLLGPEVVVLFTISRTIFSSARRILSILTNAIAPEITFSFGSGEMKKLLDIFHYSERVVFSLIPVANLGAYLFSPILLAIWLHKPGLFEESTYILMALVSAVMSMREHKQFFQFSTNVHRALAHIVFWGNLAMIAVSIPVTARFGLHGFMITWLVSETTQMALLYRENKKLFAGDSTINLVPVLKLAAFMGLMLPLCVPALDHARQHSLAVLGLAAAAETGFLFVASYFVFGLNIVRESVVTTLRVVGRAGRD